METEMAVLFIRTYFCPMIWLYCQMSITVFICKYMFLFRSRSYYNNAFFFVLQSQFFVCISVSMWVLIECGLFPVFAFDLYIRIDMLTQQQCFSYHQWYNPNCEQPHWLECRNDQFFLAAHGFHFWFVQAVAFVKVIRNLSSIDLLFKTFAFILYPMYQNLFEIVLNYDWMCVYM